MGDITELDGKELRAITGSRVRAGILIALFGERTFRRTVGELATEIGTNWSAAEREVQKLLRCGLLREDPERRGRDGPRYDADPGFPGYAEIRRLVLSTTGPPAAIRRALRQLDPRQLAWIYGPYAVGDTLGQPLPIVSVTRKRREMRERLMMLRDEIDREIVGVVMGSTEWTQRLQRHEMRVWAIRRAPRLWLVGDDDRLRSAEQYARDVSATWKHVLADWREEYGWDDDYDPSRTPLAPTR